MASGYLRMTNSSNAYFLAEVVCFEHVELAHLHIQLAFINNERVAESQRFYFCLFELRFIHVLGGTQRRLGGHDLHIKLLAVTFLAKNAISN